MSNILFKHSEQESYVRELLQEQLAMGWEGITKEVEGICITVGLPNACKVFVRREEALRNIKLSSLKKLKLDMDGLSKLEVMKTKDLRKPQDYMKSISLEDSRLEFR